jgi:hypothetical protein
MAVAPGVKTAKASLLVLAALSYLQCFSALGAIVHTSALVTYTNSVSLL